uniref:Neuropeptide n=1 Tax=Nezara viridula TaxID=85310 RepID=A0A3Q8S5S3_NEZVI|nr:neuropeptide precursor [Nezara viridula]
MYSLVFFLTAMSCLVLASSLDFYQCQPCRGEECNVEPEGCKYGISRDPCGRMQCMAGPGQRCGGRDSHLGKCGDGMTCKCGKCRGCSIDMLSMGIIECDANTAPVCY